MRTVTIIKKNAAYYILALLIIIGTLAIGVSAHATISDVTGPTITKVEANDATVKPGDHYRVFVYAEDESGMTEKLYNSYVTLTSIPKHYTENQKTETAYLSTTEEPGKYVADFVVEDDWFEGDYYITYVIVRDNYNNYTNKRYDREYPGADKTIPDVLVTVKNAIKDVKGPTITKVEATPATVKPGDHIPVYIYAEDESGMTEKLYNSYVTLTSIPKHYTENQKTETAYLSTTEEPGKYVADFVVEDDWFEGDYYITYVIVRDNYNNYTNKRYDREYPGADKTIPDVVFTMKMAEKDVTGPTITKVEANDATVKPGDHYRVFVYAEDESGMTEKLYNSYVTLTSIPKHYTENQKTETAYLSTTEEPGKYVADFVVEDDWFEGDYYITYVIVRDNLNNYTNKRYDREYPGADKTIPDVTVVVVGSGIEPSSQKEEPSSKQNEPTSKQDEPTSKQDEPTSKQDEPTSKQDEPTSKQDEPSSKQEEPSSKQNLSSSSSTRSTTRTTTTTTRSAATTRTYTTRTLVNTVKQTSVRSDVDTSDPNHLPIWIGLGLIASGAFALVYVWKEDA